MKYAAYVSGGYLWVLSCRHTGDQPNDIAIFEWYMPRKQDAERYGVRALTRRDIAVRTLKKLMAARGGWPREPWKLYGDDK